MVEELRNLPEDKQKMVRAMALSINRVNRHRDPAILPIISIAVITWVLWALFQ